MEQIKYDTIYRRFFAKIIDYFLIGILAKIFAFIFVPQTTYTINLDIKEGENPLIENPNTILDFWINYGELAISLFLILYFVLFHFFFGQTLGKMITNVKVFNVNETQKLNFSQAILRNTPDLIFALIVYFISLEYLPIIIISIWNISNLIQVFSSKKHLTINDLISKTVVLKIQQEKIIINNQTE